MIGVCVQGHHKRPIFSVDWSKGDDGLIACAGADDAILVYRPESGVDGADYTLSIRKEQAHNTDVNCVMWNPKVPAQLASCGDDGNIHIWQYQPPS